MDRLLDLVHLCSQSSQLLQENHLDNLYEELKAVKNIAPNDLKDIVNCIGRRLNDANPPTANLSPVFKITSISSLPYQ